ncbi:MAG: hypothetical protein KKE00_03540 [Proteobacteria bacterium]|nr:hypothetical protein [Pseudomonadota bacterium]
MKKVKKQTKPVSKPVATPAKRAVSSKKKSSGAAKIVKAKTVKVPNKKVSKVVKAAKPKAVKPKVAAKKPAAVPGTVLSSVLSTVKRSKNGVAIAKIKEKTGLSPRQLSNALYKLSKSGKITSKERGIYIAK